MRGKQIRYCRFFQESSFSKNSFYVTVGTEVQHNAASLLGLGYNKNKHFSVAGGL